MKQVFLGLCAAVCISAYGQTDDQLKQLDTARKILAATDLVYPFIDTPPGYIGGNEKWTNYQLNSTVLREAIKKAKAEKIPVGKYTINVKFAVNPDGTIGAVKTTNKPVGYGLEEAAVKFIRESGRWLPANVEGKEVKSTVNLPINFTIVY